jgi:outer membrane immunogenic protein
LGLEADADGLTGKDSRTLTSFPGAGVAAGDFATDSSEAIFLATIRGRFGATFDRALFYVTGGAAWGTVRTTDTFASTGGTVFQTTSNSTTRGGWTLGGGVEYAFWNNFSLKVEYLYVDLGTINAHIPTSPLIANTDLASTTVILRTSCAQV